MPRILFPLDRRPFLSDDEALECARSKSLYRLLSTIAKGSRSFDFNDFTENAAIGDYPYAVANSGGTGAASFAIPSTKVKNGAITAASGTTSGGSLSLIGPLIYRGADNAGMEVRLQSDVSANYNLEVGWIDAVPGANASGVSDIDTPAAAFTNGALFQIDTAQTLTTLATVTKGNAASQAIQATTVGSARTVTDGATTNTSTTLTSATAVFTGSDVGAAISGTGIPAATTIASVTNATTVVLSAAATATGTGVSVTIRTPLSVLPAATYATFSVQLVQAGASASVAQALFFINGTLVARHDNAVGVVNGATLLAPWIYLKTNNTTTKNLTVDYIARWSDRNA